MKNEENYLVTKSNKLIDARYKSALTIREQKIILYIVSKIQKDDDEFKNYSLSVKTFSEMMGLKGSPKYSEFHKLTKSLMSKVIEIEEENGLLQTHWMSKVKYNYGAGTIEFSFPNDLKPYLLQLKKEFTSYKIRNILYLNSTYSIRMYELLKKNEFKKEFTVSLADLREMLGTEHLYQEYSNFKLRVLKKAQEELKESTDIKFDYEEIKEGKKVDKIRFVIKNNKKVEEEIIEEQEDWITAYHEKITLLFDSKGIKLPYDVLIRWVRIADKIYDNNAEKIRAEIQLICEQTLFKNSINNPIGFITFILNEKAKLVEMGKDPDDINIENTKFIRTEIVPMWHKRNNNNEEDEPSYSSEEVQREREKLLEELGIAATIK